MKSSLLPLLFGLTLAASACAPRAVDPTPPGFPITLGRPWTVVFEDRTFGFVLTRDVTSNMARQLKFYDIQGTDSNGNTVEASSLLDDIVSIRVFEQRFDEDPPATARAHVCRAVRRDGRWLGNSFYGSLLQETEAIIEQLKQPDSPRRPPNCEVKPAG